MANHATKVIGFFPYATSMQVVCTGKACVIAGSEQAMRKYSQEIDPDHGKTHTVRKTRFGEIIQGLHFGAAYSFDAESCARFYPLARTEGLNIALADVEASRQHGDRFFTVELTGS